jgi:hypothetical protein
MWNQVNNWKDVHHLKFKIHYPKNTNYKGNKKKGHNPVLLNSGKI